MMQQRLETLESKLAYLEITIDELNQVVYAQSKQLERAQALIKGLQGKVDNIEDDAQAKPFSAEDERPPHY